MRRADDDPPARPEGARADFVASLGRRLEALRAALESLEEEPGSSARRDNVRRRLHAMSAAARVLGFEHVSDTLSDAEETLVVDDAQAPVAAAQLAVVRRALELVPSMVWGAAPAEHTSAAKDEPTPGNWPVSVLVYGGAALASSLVQEAARGRELEAEQTSDPGRARELARTVAPDVLIVDADVRGARQLIETVLQDPMVEPMPIVAMGTFERPEASAGWVSLGASKVLAKPVSPEQLRRALEDSVDDARVVREPGEPIGDVTVNQLEERVFEEIRRGLSGAVDSSGKGALVSIGDGSDVLAAVWGAVARVRELVTMRSGGTVRFRAGGPEGAIPLAPWTAADEAAGRRTAGTARSDDGVSLKGRRILVVDDDPAVVWFMTGVFRAAGAEVIEAHDGRTALRLVHERWPDVVVSDILMPELDGFGLCRAIKRDVAVRDVPVILLSWKEDLLQRVRELGADADGYLRKEAAGSAVLERVREVLRPRARVEARLADGGKVRGRLEGLTPRLLLELVCGARGDATITVRDAIYLYEVGVRSGRPQYATRTARDGTTDRGPAVLGALLGVSAGRFAVVPDRTPCGNDFGGPLEKVLAEPVARTRAIQSALEGDGLMRIGRVELEPSSVHAYLAVTPGAARELVEHLARGSSPRELLVGGALSPRLLEAVLSDLALHGGIRRLLDVDGKELTGAAPSAPATRLSEQSLAAVRPSAPPEPDDDEGAMSLGEAIVAAGDDEKPVSSNTLITAGEAAQEAIARAEAEADNAPRESTTLPTAGEHAREAERRAADFSFALTPEPEGASSAFSDSAWFDRNSDPLTALPSTSPEAPEAKAASAAPEAASDEAEPEAAPSEAHEDDDAERDPGMGDALIHELTDSSPPEGATASASSDPAPESDDEAASESGEQPAVRDVPRPEGFTRKRVQSRPKFEMQALEPQAPMVSTSLESEADESEEEEASEAGSLIAGALAASDDDVSEVAAERAEKEREAEAQRKAEEERERLEAERRIEAARREAEQAEEEARRAKEATERARKERRAAEEAARRFQEASKQGRGGTLLMDADATKPADAAPVIRDRSGEQPPEPTILDDDADDELPAVDLDSRKFRTKTGDDVATEHTPEPARPSTSPGASSWLPILRLGGVTVATAALAYFGVRAVVGGDDAGSSATGNEPGAAKLVPVATPGVDPSSLVPASQQLKAKLEAQKAEDDTAAGDDGEVAGDEEAEGRGAKKNTVKPKIETLALPEAVKPMKGKGLIEIDTADERPKMWVDGEVIGRGPLRRAWASPGEHRVRLRLGGVEHEFTVSVTPDKRTRLTMPDKWAR